MILIVVSAIYVGLFAGRTRWPAPDQTFSLEPASPAVPPATTENNNQDEDE
jgi:hypothetical protein